MKTCTRYLDYLEQKGFETDSPEWQDIVAHSSRCPDCSSDMKLRGAMFEALEQMGEPKYPVDLHMRILQEVESAPAAPGEAESWFDRVFDFALRPLEIGFSLACVLMIVLMFSAENEPQHLPKSAAPIVVAGAEPLEAVKPVEDLDPVSAEEVQQFLARLDGFNRRNPQPQPAGENYMPELRLVNDWK
ncbi:MAG: hypothetical protein AB1403_19755 [Candidatus Riflebacteria bacterium]